MGNMSRLAALAGLAMWMIATVGSAAAPAGTATPTPTPLAPKYNPRTLLAGLKPGVYAVFETDHGNFVSILFTKKAPRTTANFIGLAEGVREFRDPTTGKRVKRPYYDGIIFHRVRRNGLIQTGDPTGRGNGGTGYYFDDEFVPSLMHDKPGVMSMATEGPGTNTNDGQFAISLHARPELDMKYSVFGEIVKGLDVALAIGAVPTVPGQPERPAPPEPRIRTLRIYRVGPDGAITDSPPPPNVDIRMRWAGSNDEGPSAVGARAQRGRRGGRRRGGR